MRSTQQIQVVFRVELLLSSPHATPTLLTTSLPKMYPHPRELTRHPDTSSSGSDHSRSQIPPSRGTSCTRLIDRAYPLRPTRSRTASRVVIEGERPPCTQKMRSSIKAPRFRQSNTSTHCFHTFTVPYFRIHSS